MKTLSIIFLLLSMSLNASVVYKKVNKDGSITYSDEPSNGAKELDLSNSNSAVMPSLVNNDRKVNQPEPAKVKYQLKIISPSPEQTIRNNSGQVNIVASIKPLVPGKYQLMLNGAVHTSQTGGKFQLEAMPRGEYSIQLRFVGNSGKVLALTDTQSFYLHKASALINAN
jgi:septal ring-binding cell division protein DamX